MRSNMPAQKDFSQNPSVTQPRSVFNRSHTHKSTFDVDNLVPFYVDEILPGDSQTLKANIFARLSSTMGFPIMDNLHLDTFYFFVPYRILWDNWEKFMGAQDDPGDSIDFTIPQMVESGGGDEVQSLADYMGIPPGLDYSVSSLPGRAYVKIYNEWFRDENLQDSIAEFSGDGPEDESLYTVLKRGKRHDYFTSCLPFPQKGAAVDLALGNLTGQVPVRGTGGSLGMTDNVGGFGLVFRGSEGLNAATTAYDADIGDSAGGGTNPALNVAMGVVEEIDGKSGLEADLTGVSLGSITINEFRLAVATQQLLELDARGGTRYFEILKAHFGVSSPDSRLQRPEYLGGSTQMININPVTQTSVSLTGENAQGNQSAYATANTSSGYSKSFVEHGVVLGLVNIRADLSYSQGIDQMWTRSTRYDFYFPTFANLGEQPVLNKEIFYQDSAADDQVFGYQEAWASYRYKKSQISGRFRPDVASSLDAWHLSQDFSALPVLNVGFITENLTQALNRTLTVPGTATVPNIIFDSWIQLKHARVMPTYSIPGLKRL